MKWIKSNERLPDNSKEVFGKDEKGRKWVVLYAHKHKIEVSDYEDELDEETIDVHNDAIYLKPGWYELCEQHGGSYDEIYFPRNIVEWWDESPSPSLQEAAEAYADQMTSKTPEYKVSVLDFAAGWNAREAQGSPTISKTETVYQQAAEEFAKEALNIAEMWRLKKFPKNVYDMRKADMIEVFVEEMSKRQAQQTGPILTRELHDKIWNAAMEWAYEVETNHYPDQETFWKSLNL